MNAYLPESLILNNQNFQINADFRNVLRIFEAFEDNALTKREKAYICVKRLYLNPIPETLIETAVQEAYWFVGGGDMPKTKPEEIKMLDWKHDASILFPAVSKAAGVIDVRSLDFLHWWTFLGLFGEVGEGLFSTVMHIRHKQNHGKTLEKYEREFLSRNQNLIILRTPEEQAAIDETEAFLRTIT